MFDILNTFFPNSILSFVEKINVLIDVLKNALSPINRTVSGIITSFCILLQLINALDFIVWSVEFGSNNNVDKFLLEPNAFIPIILTEFGIMILDKSQ